MASRTVTRRVLSQAPRGRMPPPSAAAIERQQHHKTRTAVQSAPVQMTTLTNGVRVASKNIPGVWGNVTVLFRSGPRFETPEFRGASFFMERLSFKSTSKRSQSQVIGELEMLGGDTMCHSNRESLLYSANVHSEDAGRVLEIMADSMVRPEYREDEIAEIQASLEPLSAMCTERPETVLLDAVHKAGFGDATYGNFQLCPPETGLALTRDKLHEYRARVLQPEDIVIASSGLDHNMVVEYAEEHFGSHVLPASPSAERLPRETPKFLGGEFAISSDKPILHPALGTPLVHAGIAFEASAWGSEDVFPAAVLQALLGGGNSFSVGGPGKGMYSWFYAHILNIYHFVDSALATSQNYPDSGLFIIQTSAPEDKIKTSLSAMLRTMLLASSQVPDEALDRAKNQLKSLLMHNLESRAVTAEDLARQIAAVDHRMTEEELCAQIDAVDVDSLQGFVRRLLSSRPAIGVCGSSVCPVNSEMLQETLQSSIRQLH